MKSKKIFYYAVIVPAACGSYRYFKAINKKQIKTYCALKYLQIEMILDPNDKPVKNINYIDITNIKPAK